jgi:hypothetical protein
MEILLDLEHDQREKRKATFSRYRRLLESLDDRGALPEKDRPTFGKLVAELSLTADDIRAHVKSLERHKRGLDTEAKAKALEAERARLEKPIAEWAAKRERIMAELEAEGGPLTRQAAELDRQLTNLQWSRTAAQDEEGNHPELYGIAPLTRPPEPDPHRDYAAEQADLADRSLCESMAASLRGCPEDAAPVVAMPEAYREILARGVERGWVRLSDVHAAALKPAEVETREVAAVSAGDE